MFSRRFLIFFALFLVAFIPTVYRIKTEMAECHRLEKRVSEKTQLPQPAESGVVMFQFSCEAQVGHLRTPGQQVQGLLLLVCGSVILITFLQDLWFWIPRRRTVRFFEITR